MKFTKLFAAIAALTIVATSCEAPFEEPNAEGKKISLCPTMDNFTKATDTAFEEGDQVGVHILIPNKGTYLNNAHFTYTNGALVGAEDYYWYVDETTVSDVVAYYPYNATGSYRAAGYNFTVNADQSKPGAYTASDLMVAATTSKPTAAAVELPFRHVLSKVVIKLDNQLADEVIENVWFSEVFGTTTVNLKEGTSVAEGRKGTIKTAKVTTGEEQAWALIIVPQENVTPKLIVTTESGKQFTYQLSGEISFSAGKVSTATITISDDSIYTAFTPTISDWEGDNDLQFGQSESGDFGDIEGGGTTDGTRSTIYFHPNMWNVDGAWFAAHAWNDAGAVEDVTLADNDGDGVYEGTIAADMTSVLFCRMNPEFTEFSWDEGHVWNQTGNLTIGVAPNNHFYITAWDNGEWNTSDYVVDIPVQTSGLGVVGGFAASNWGTDIPLMSTDVAGLTVAKNITFNAGEGFKIRTIGTWDEVNVGAKTISFAEANKYFAVEDNSTSADICVVMAGNYDIYFNQSEMRVYLMTAGTPYTEATEQTENGKEQEPEEPDSTDKVIYFSVGSAAAGSRYAAYFWDEVAGTNTWASMTDNDGDKIYEVNIPVGYGTKVIFCSMKGTANGWSNKVNQTHDLDIPTDGKNLFTLGSWKETDGGSGSWSVK